MSDVADLGRDFWTWRRSQQPRSHDDIPRIERPEGWLPRWSADDVARYRAEAAAFRARWSAIDVGTHTDPRPDVQTWVDHALLGTAIARVDWELDHLKIWQEQPRFYVDQSIGVVFDELTAPNVDAARIERVIQVLEHVPTVLAQGIANLEGHAVREFADFAREELTDIPRQMTEFDAALSALATPEQAPRLHAAVQAASEALVAFSDWIAAARDSMPAMRPIGREQFQWFLSNVALTAMGPEEMLSVAQVEFERAIVLEALERNRNRSVPIPPLPASAQAQADHEAAAEAQVREFYESRDILSQPDTLQHYLNAPLPAYLRPIRWLGVTDDLTGPSRVDSNGVSYVPDPGPELPYFYQANARDPRAGIVHEGAHYQQLAMSWRHPREIRRYYYDSGPNEGIAFYNEELMLASGLFDDAPHSRTIMYNFIRLRALRVILDVNLAIGNMDAETATEFLSKKVPMDHETARQEAVFFTAYPGQGLTYQIGKTQILRFFIDAMATKGTDFSIRHFHDYLWLNGNVPLSLQRLEYLGDATDINLVLHNQQKGNS